ncbi:MAG TPA: hypothetical protein PKD86_13165 [Gemmatales bacterium]|nr:hypothetical protein [Gemmatales bacterium]HMP60291.1 hypothetical protein [Gemmatales bacterium]
MSSEHQPSPTADAFACLERILGVLAEDGRVRVTLGGQQGILQASGSLSTTPAVGTLVLVPDGPELAAYLPALPRPIRKALRFAPPGTQFGRLPLPILSAQAPLPEATRRLFEHAGHLDLFIPKMSWLQILAEARPDWVVWMPADAQAAADQSVELGENWAAEPAPACLEWRESIFVTETGENWPSALPPAMILFVCTGNTCRSPMAAALARTWLAQTLGCSEAQLAERGWRIESAGVAARPEEPASVHAREAVRRWQADLESHRSQQLSAEALLGADVIYAMTQAHVRLLAPHTEPNEISLQLLAGEGYDISDPFGGDQAAYDQCAAMIWQAIQERGQQWLTLMDHRADRPI